MLGIRLATTPMRKFRKTPWCDTIVYLSWCPWFVFVNKPRDATGERKGVAETTVETGGKKKPAWLWFLSPNWGLAAGH